MIAGQRKRLVKNAVIISVGVINGQTDILTGSEIEDANRIRLDTPIIHTVIVVDRLVGISRIGEHLVVQKRILVLVIVGVAGNLVGMIPHPKPILDEPSTPDVIIGIPIFYLGLNIVLLVVVAFFSRARIETILLPERPSNKRVGQLFTDKVLTGKFTWRSIYRVIAVSAVNLGNADKAEPMIVCLVK